MINRLQQKYLEVLTYQNIIWTKYGLRSYLLRSHFLVVFFHMSLNFTVAISRVVMQRHILKRIASVVTRQIRLPRSLTWASICSGSGGCLSTTSLLRSPSEYCFGKIIFCQKYSPLLKYFYMGCNGTIKVLELQRYIRIEQDAECCSDRRPGLLNTDNYWTKFIRLNSELRLWVYQLMKLPTF